MRIIYLLFSIRGFSKPAAVKTAARTACAFSRGLRKKRAGPSELLGIMHIFPNIMRLSKIPFLRSARRPIMKGYASILGVSYPRFNPTAKAAVMESPQPTVFTVWIFGGHP